MPRFLDDLRAVTADLLVQHGLTEEQADRVAAALVETARREHGGTRVYIRTTPSGRDRVIYTEWQAGTPPRELARRHGLALASVYRALRRMRRTTPRSRSNDDT